MGHVPPHLVKKRIYELMPCISLTEKTLPTKDNFSRKLVFQLRISIIATSSACFGSTYFGAESCSYTLTQAYVGGSEVV